MISTDVIIVGAGPAGSTCAWKLRQHGIPVIILEKQVFPRLKVCAGWITPNVFSDLCVENNEYPFSLSIFRQITFHFWGKKVPLRTRQYAIRRSEFDHWLLQRSNAPVHYHRVEKIRKQNGFYIIDERYRCRYLVGAGGTHCPVYTSLFEQTNPRRRHLLITAMEEEFPYASTDPHCYLWFFDHGLPGYSWYVPKGNGHVNVGVGGRLITLKERQETIGLHWDRLIHKLEHFSLVKEYPFRPKGHNYYLRQPVQTGQLGNAFIIGDAAGLATVDMGEGIGPAVESGLLAAAAIVNGAEYHPQSIPRYSIKSLLFPGKARPW